ncbi:MAG: WYL domain-containing protein [Kiritimatiellae bacterium]|nr:WYL domain-containing protein [Kiritimatiellia bacterium]
MNREPNSIPPTMIAVSQDAVRKFMRHGWNVYPLEAFGFLLGTASPPCVHAALPASKTAHWDSHTDRWNGLVEKRPVADEVAALFGFQVVGVYATHEKGVDLRPFPADFAAGIVITYSFDCGTNWAGVHSAALHAPGVGRDDWKLSRGKRLSTEVNHRRILKAWRDRVGPIDYSNNYKTEYPRLYGTLPDKPTRYPPPKQQQPEPKRAPSPLPTPRSPYYNPYGLHCPPPPDPLDRWSASQRVAVDANVPLTAQQQTILAAIRNQTKLTFRYIGGSRPGDIRTARPKELFQVAGYPGCYLLAEDLDLGEERVFRLDRIAWQP